MKSASERLQVCFFLGLTQAYHVSGRGIAAVSAADARTADTKYTQFIEQQQLLKMETFNFFL
jgi:hypothetical protein